MFSPSGDFKSVSVGDELLLSKMSFPVYSDETAPEHPGANSETFSALDLHCKDAFKKKNMM
jgi:hypothetical protein